MVSSQRVRKVKKGSVEVVVVDFVSCSFLVMSMPYLRMQRA